MASHSQRGRTVRIYLADGTASGLRHAELANWTGQALMVPRTLIAESRHWKEVERPGVYFLIGPEGRARRTVYIGEAESIRSRLFQQVTRDEWEVAIAFTSKDDHLTKAHVRYLEAVLIRKAVDAGRYEVLNAKQTDLPSLPRGDRDGLDEFIDCMNLILGTLGHPLLDPLQVTERSPDEAGLNPSPPSSNAGLGLSMRTGGVQARGVLTPDGLVVFQGATGQARNQSRNYTTLKDRLLEAGILKPHQDDRVILTRDHLFPSASQAASVLSGTDLNGRVYWKVPDGRSLKEWELTNIDRVDAD